MITLIALICVLAVCVAAAFAEIGEYESEDYDATYTSDSSLKAAYGFHINDYAVTYDIGADRVSQVEEVITLTYYGVESTGFVRSIPINAGDRVRSLEVYEVIDGDEYDVDYSVTYEYEGYVAADIGDTTNKYNTEHTYKITYEYAITKPQSENAIYLNPIGYGWDCEIENAEITLNLPDGFLSDESTYYIGSSSATSASSLYSDGVITLDVTETLKRYNGVTFDLIFEEGVLGTKTDITGYIVVIAACVLLGVLAAVKFLCFNKDGLTPITTVEPPDDIDPLVMGKLIDNRVDKSDVTSLIYYWANLNYLKIDMKDKDDVRLIRIRQYLPESAPDYQKMMYNRLFSGGDLVAINSLKNTFYTTVDSVTKKVNAESGKLYTGRSMGIAVVFAMLGALFMALTPFAAGYFSISSKFRFLPAIVCIVPAFIVFALAQTVKFGKYKKKRGKVIASFIGVAVLSAAFTVIYIFWVPSYILEVVPKVLLCVVGYALVISSVSLISRTPAYTEQLNKIMGFKDFIMSVDKDRLETLLEGNPELYYSILPYAQVLGVSDIWIEKFKALTVEPPKWAIGYSGADVFDLVVFTHLMRGINTHMAMTMTGRPSSSGLSGGGGGHFGGGGGFGHGGGGGFGR